MTNGERFKPLDSNRPSTRAVHLLEKKIVASFGFLRIFEEAS